MKPASHIGSAWSKVTSGVGFAEHELQYCTISGVLLVFKYFMQWDILFVLKCVLKHRGFPTQREFVLCSGFDEETL